MLTFEKLNEDHINQWSFNKDDRLQGFITELQFCYLIEEFDPVTESTYKVAYVNSFELAEKYVKENY